MLAGLVATMPAGVAAQPPGAGAPGNEAAFVEQLRREDPASADRYVELRDAREKAMADYRRVQQQYSAAGPDLKFVFGQSLRQAQRRYAEASLALLDFLDARDRQTIARYEEAIRRITTILEENQRNRAELDRMLKD